MTKKQLLDKHFEISDKANKELSPILDKLVEEGRITSGAAYLIHTWYQWYGYKAISEVLQKAGHSKNYTRYLKRIDLWQWKYWIKDMEDSYQKALDFITEQENLPFEQSQKQVLIAEGKLDK